VEEEEDEFIVEETRFQRMKVRWLDALSYLLNLFEMDDDLT
jgi:hypothetical protein